MGFPSSCLNLFEENTNAFSQKIDNLAKMRHHGNSFIHTQNIVYLFLSRGAGRTLFVLYGPCWA